MGAAKPIPTTKVYKDGGYLIVNQCDAAAWTAKGWSLTPEQVKKESKAPEPDKKAVLKDLRDKGSKLGILNAGKLSEAELTKAIAEVEAAPQQ